MSGSDGSGTSSLRRGPRSWRCTSRAQCEAPPALGASQLQHLDLQFNSVGDEGAKALAQALGASRLQRLDLEENFVGAEGAKVLREASKHTPRAEIKW